MTKNVFELKSAAEVLLMAQNEPSIEFIAEAVKYSQNKFEALSGKNKRFRASLWQETLKSLAQLEPQEMPKNQENLRQKDKGKRADDKKPGMKKYKSCGISFFVSEGMTQNGVGMIRQGIRALFKTSMNNVKAQEKAYKLWKAGGNNDRHSLTL